MSKPRFSHGCHSPVDEGAVLGRTLVQFDSTRFIGDVVTNDIIFKKVSQRRISAPARCGHAALLYIYIIYIFNRNNVTMSPAPVFRGFVGDVRVTFFCIVPHPKVEQAFRLSSLMPTCPIQAPSFSFQISNTGASQ